MTIPAARADVITALRYMNAEVLTTADKECRRREQQRAKEEERQADDKPPIARAKSAPASSKADSSNAASPRP